jgi:F-type H+-transporting ATPase subunit delta
MSQIAARYANALYAKVDEKTAPKVLRDLDLLHSWCDDSAEFKSFMRNPLISREDAIKAVDKLASSARFHSLSKDFLVLVARKRRLALLPQIIAKVVTLSDQKQGIVKTIITSAQKLSSLQLKNIQQLLTEKMNKTPKTTEIIDPRVLGGFKVKIGPYLIDATLKTQLMQLQLLLKEA